MTRKVVSFALFIIAAGLLIWWFAAGHQMWTTTQHMVQVKDELFGTTTEQWEPRFTPGLEWIGPIAAVLIIIAGWLLYRARKIV
jgi:hypothetical protein